MKKTHLLALLFAVMLFAASCGDDDPVVRPRPEAVDLGLSVKWANYNIGASEAVAWGGLYGWADSSGLHKVQIDDYPIEVSWSTVGGREITSVKWNSPYFGGKSPLSNITGTTFDIARYMWNADWRMPTRAEWQELIERCEWTVATGIEGARGTVIRVTGPSGASILLPMTGYDTTGTPERSNVGHYWTSTLLPIEEQSEHGFSSAVACAAWSVTITIQGGVPKCTMEPQVRNFHLGVRPVYAR